MSAATFKVQRIRSCVQCGEVLAVKCKACVKHPERKPRIIEYYGWPEILAVCPCKCSVKIACQRDGCRETMWRNRTHNAGGLSRSETLFCSRRCNLIIRAQERDTRVLVPCGWHLCATKVPRSRALVKRFQSAYCRPDHYFLARKKAAHEARLAARREDEARVLLQCQGSCRGEVTEHVVDSKTTASCTACRTPRDARVVIAGA